VLDLEKTDQIPKSPKYKTSHNLDIPIGWDPFNVSEVYPEYSAGNKRADYALRYNNRNKVQKK